MAAGLALGRRVHLGFATRPLSWPKMAQSVQVALARIAEHGDDLARGYRPGDIDRGRHVRARGWTHQKRLAQRELARHLCGADVRNEHNLVDQLAIQEVRNEARAEPLNAVKRRSPTTEHRRSRWLHRHQADLLAELAAQYPTYAGERTTRADAANERGNVAAGLLEDLERRALCVTLRVGDVRALGGHERPCRLLSQLTGTLDGASHAALSGRQLDLGTVGLENQAPLHAHVLGHDQNTAVPPHRGDHREADARVATRGFDDGARRGQEATLLGVDDHGQGGPVFDATAGIQELALGEHRRRAGWTQARQAHQRAAGDQAERVLGDTVSGRRSAHPAQGAHAAQLPSTHWPSLSAGPTRPKWPRSSASTVTGTPPTASRPASKCGALMRANARPTPTVVRRPTSSPSGVITRSPGASRAGSPVTTRTSRLFTLPRASCMKTTSCPR